MADKIRILVTDDSAETRELIKQLIQLSDQLELFGEAQSGLEVMELLKTGLPDVVLMDINMPGMNGLEATERISKLYPTLIVIMMSVQGETEYLRKAMISGAREYLVKPFSLEVLEECVMNAYGLEQERRQVQKLSLEQRNLQGESKVISFFSSKGGVGKSVLALNTALALVQSGAGRTIVVDLDLQFGDMGILGNLKSSRTMTEAIEDNAIGDPELLTGYLQTIGSVDVLLAPKKPEMAEYISERHVEQLLQTLKKMYRYIIIDTAVNFGEINLGTLDHSDQVLMVSTMDLLSLKNTRLGLEVLRSLHHLDKVSLIINRAGRTSGISPADVEKAMSIKPLVYVQDEERTVMDSVNLGQPLAADKKFKGSKFYKALEALTASIQSR